jgi:hypothetical protein
VIDEVHSWIVCAAIATPDGMAHNFTRIMEITSVGTQALAEHVKQAELKVLEDAKWLSVMGSGSCARLVLDRMVSNRKEVSDA